MRRRINQPRHRLRTAEDRQVVRSLRPKAGANAGHLPPSPGSAPATPPPRAVLPRLRRCGAHRNRRLQPSIQPAPIRPATARGSRRVPRSTRRMAPGSDLQLNQLAANRFDRNLIRVLNGDHRRPAARSEDDAIGFPRSHSIACTPTRPSGVAKILIAPVSGHESSRRTSARRQPRHGSATSRRRSRESESTSAPRACFAASGSMASNSAGATHRDSMSIVRQRCGELSQAIGHPRPRRRARMCRCADRRSRGRCRLASRGDEVVVHRDAAPAEQPQQRRAVAFDVRREDSRRCARRALTRRPRLEDRDARACFRKLIGNGAADDACTDDDDGGLHSWKITKDTKDE